MTTTLPRAAAGAGVAAEPALWTRIDRRAVGRSVFVAACTAATGLGLTWPSPRLPFVAATGLLIGCWPILMEALADLRRRRMSMEASMLIAVLAAAAIGEWMTALLITTFVLAAEILEDLSLDRGRDALTGLLAFLPDAVQVRRAGTIATVALADVRAGDVVIAPGSQIPVDGVVCTGHSTVDQSRITGESLPANLEPGSRVFAGSINHVGALEVLAEHVGTQSSYGRIIEAVRAAQESEPPVQRLADRLAAGLIYLALAGAALTFLVTRSLTNAIAVVVVAGACGIAAGTPLAVLAAIARAARRGAFVKDGAHLEALSTIDTVVFDKTGTLTVGDPVVVEVQPAPGLDADAVLSAAAAVESYSEHPLAGAVVAAARARGLALRPAEDFCYTVGRGVRARVGCEQISVGSATLVSGAPDGVERTGTSMIHIAADDRFLGTIVLADPIRPTAADAVAELHHLGLRTMMITGDAAPTAQAVAAQVGVDDIHADLLPEQKLAAIDAERASGHRLAMVGDGVNDAPALARAQVGIAMGNGTEIARDSADVILLSSDLNDLVACVRTARRARRIIMANFVGTIVVDLFGMTLAALGWLGPVGAALVDVVSETAFILNSARLIPIARPARR